MARDVFDKVRQGLLNELELHREDIEGGNLNWFSIKVILNRSELRGTWQQEENCRIDPAWADYGAPIRAAK